MRPILFADDLSMEDPAVHAPLSHILPTRCHAHDGVMQSFGACRCDGREFLYPPAPPDWVEYPEGLEEWHATCELLWALMRIIE